MKKLYDEDSLLFSFTASVEKCVEGIVPDFYGIVLDQTAFFPEGGGQPADHGFLNFSENGQPLEVPVYDVKIKEGVIYHYTKSPIPINTQVSGTIDKKRRLDFMQQHSGEHIFSGLVHRLYGANNVGFHLNTTDVTLDFDLPLTEEELEKAEFLANEAIRNDIPVKAEYPDSRELEALDYRSKLELTENVRIVTIPDCDICACCAPHVLSTGQIGMIKITNIQSHRGGVRVNILCGLRALEDYRIKQKQVESVSASLSAKQARISDAVDKLKQDNLALKEQFHRLQTKYLLEKTKSLPGPKEQEHILLIEEQIDDIAVRNVINTLMEQYPGYICVFWKTGALDFRYLIGSKTLDCKKINDLLRQEMMAKGGGKSSMVQGSLSASEEKLDLFLRSVLS